MKKIILVIGGTGLLGQPVARALHEAGFQARIMTRDRLKAEKLFDGSYENFTGDPLDPKRLAEALDGCYGVHISLPSEVEHQAVEAVAKVAAGSGVERITYISGLTVAEEHRWFPMIDRKFQAEKVIRESGIAYTIFCPTWIMDSLPLFVRQGRASVLGSQPTPYHWVAAQDCARMVSTAYELADAVNRRFLVSGPEAITIHEALRRYCAAFYPEIRQVTTMPFWLVRLLAGITGDRGLKEAGEMMSYFEKVGERASVSAGIDGILPAPATTLDRWLEAKKGVIKSLP